MKKLVLALLISLIPYQAHAENVTIAVKGMVCSFCAQGIKKTFERNTKLQDVKVDLDQKLVTLKVIDGSTVGDEELKQMINDAGYDVLSIERGKEDVAPKSN